MIIIILFLGFVNDYIIDGFYNRFILKEYMKKIDPKYIYAVRKNIVEAR